MEGYIVHELIADQSALDELTDSEMHLYSRQILLDGWDIEAQERLKLSNVFIVGAGGIGCTVAQCLARAGVGKITIIDQDRIEVSNLQRQIAFNTTHIGQYKAKVLAESLREINPFIDVDGKIDYLNADNIDELIQGYDLVLDGCDNFQTRYIVNASCKKQNIPLLSASAIGFQGQLFMVNAQSACYECLFPKTGHDLETMNCTQSGVLATTPIVIASLQAHYALLYLALNRQSLLQKLLLWDGLQMKQRIIDFDHDADCPICATSFDK